MCVICPDKGQWYGSGNRQHSYVGAWIGFVASEGDQLISFANYNGDDGSYYVYLQPGTYNVLCQGKMIKESVVVGNTDMTCDTNTSLCRVDVTAQSFANVILFDAEGVREDFGCDEDGKYFLFLGNGTYTLVKYDDALDLETKDEVSLEDIADDKKTTFTVDGANTKVEMK